MDDKLSIRVNIAERFYPLKIERNDEEKIRKAVKMINDKIIQYKQRYGDKDNQDFLAMVALQYATQAIEGEPGTGDSGLLDEIRKMTNELDTYINKT